MKSVTSRKAALGIQISIKNAKNFIKVSEILIGKKCYREAYLLLLYALEEEGRVVLIWNSPFHSATEKSWQKYLLRFRSHDEKFWFSGDLDSFAAGKQAFKSNKKKAALFSKRKQRYAYVDFYENGFRSPKKVSRQEVGRILATAQKRLSYLKQNHPSAVSDEKNIESALKRLKGLTRQQIEAMIKDGRRGK